MDGIQKCMEFENAKNSRTYKEGKTDETTSKKQLECDFEIVDLLKDVQSNINENVELQSKYDLKFFLIANLKGNIAQVH